VSRLSLVKQPPEAKGEDAQIFLLIAASRAALASFRGELEAGTLRPPQHAALRLVEEALHPLQVVPAEGQPE
jgi:hypothetical protein